MSAQVFAPDGSVLANLGEPGPKHAMTNHIVEVNGDSASSRSYLNVGSGIYTVEYVRTPEGWRAKQFHMRNYSAKMRDLRRS